MEFLGHNISGAGVKIHGSKVEKVLKYPTPKDRSALLSFLGLASYCRHFVPGFSGTARPLYDLTSTKAPFDWGAAQARAFEALKKRIAEAPCLAQPDAKARDGSRPFVIYTDASKTGLGAVLAQEGDDGRLHPIHFQSQTLTSGPAQLFGHRPRSVGGKVCGAEVRPVHIWH